MKIHKAIILYNQYTLMKGRTVSVDPSRNLPEGRTTRTKQSVLYGTRRGAQLNTAFVSLFFHSMCKHWKPRHLPMKVIFSFFLCSHPASEPNAQLQGGRGETACAKHLPPSLHLFLLESFSLSLRTIYPLLFITSEKTSTAF